MASVARVTSPRMTKFERTQLIGMRMEQLARGAPTTAVDVPAGASIRDVVLLELQQRTMPLLVSRTLPNGTVETFRVADFVD